MIACVVLLLSILVPPAIYPPIQLKLKDGDRIVWLGGTHTEREQKYGHWETELQVANPKINFTVRNLGWSGDTVFGESRAAFDTPKEGFKRLIELTLSLKPTIIFVDYGANESFEGENGISKFKEGYEKLLDALAPAKAKVVLFAPITQANSNLVKNQENYERYGKLIEAIAQERKLDFVNLNPIHETTTGTPIPIYESNQIHLSDSGYKATALRFGQQLGLSQDLLTTEERNKRDAVSREDLRKAIIAKNELFFHRWRPQNETYLFGFRKHEQGKNAKEIVEFDPLVDMAEANIQNLKQKWAK